MRSREGDPDNHGEGLGVGGLLDVDLPRHGVHVHGGDDLNLLCVYDWRWTLNFLEKTMAFLMIVSISVLKVFNYASMERAEMLKRS